MVPLWSSGYVVWGWVAFDNVIDPVNLFGIQGREGFLDLEHV